MRNWGQSCLFGRGRTRSYMVSRGEAQSFVSNGAKLSSGDEIQCRATFSELFSPPLIPAGIPAESGRNLGIPPEFRRNPAGIQEFCRNDQIPWIPGGFRQESSRNSYYFPNISTFGDLYIRLYSYLNYTFQIYAKFTNI